MQHEGALTMLIADVLAPFVDGKTYRACARDLGKERSASKAGRAGMRGWKGVVPRRCLHRSACQR